LANKYFVRMNLFAIKALFLFATAYSANIDFDWNSGFGGEQFQALDVSNGDTITFNWSGGHNVYLMPNKAAYDGCDFSSATMISGGDTSGVTYTVTTFPTYFACEKTGHCNGGQKLTVTETAIDTTAAATTQAATTAAADPNMKVFSRNQGEQLCIQVSLDPNVGNCGMIAGALPNQQFVEAECAGTYPDVCPDKVKNEATSSLGQLTTNCPTADVMVMCVENLTTAAATTASASTTASATTASAETTASDTTASAETTATAAPTTDDGNNSSSGLTMLFGALITYLLL